MIKLVNILKEIGDASKTFNTSEVDQGQHVWFKINDSNFPIDNFWISINIGEKDDIINETPDNNVKPRFNVSKYKSNAAKVDFGIIENNQWTFPVINKGYLFGIMGTVVDSIKKVLDKNKSIKYLLFIPANKVKSNQNPKPNQRFNLNKNPPPQENTAISDNGAQRQNLYLTYVKKQLPSAKLSIENGWNVIELS